MTGSCTSSPRLQAQAEGDGDGLQVDNQRCKAQHAQQHVRQQLDLQSGGSRGGP